jgi:hypothetical protein
MIPKKIKLMGHWYEIKRGHDCKNDADSRTWCNVISIDPEGPDKTSKSESSMWCNLFHEINHVGDDLLGYDLYRENESACEGMAQFWYQVLVDNKLLKI